MFNTFDENRNEFKPYGLTCELWSPSLMKRPDRHNEIEINYFPEVGITYLFQGRKVIVPPKKLTVFWGLVPHQIIDFKHAKPYYVCTVPFSLFLEWQLAGPFVEGLLKGDIVFEESEDHSGYDEFLLKNWLNDINGNGSSEVALLEIHARISRMSTSMLSLAKNKHSSIQGSGISHVERIAIFIA